MVPVSKNNPNRDFHKLSEGTFRNTSGRNSIKNAINTEPIVNEPKYGMLIAKILIRKINLKC